MLALEGPGAIAALCLLQAQVAFYSDIELYCELLFMFAASMSCILLRHKALV